MTAVASYVLLPNILPDVCGKNGVLRIPTDANTLTGFRRWVHSATFPEKLRCHFVGGNIFLDMTQEAIDTHVLVKGAVFRTLPNLLVEEDRGEFYTDGVLLTNKAAQISNNPDGIAALWETLESGRLRYYPSVGKAVELQGTPDWVMEIVSDSSVTKDTKLLRRAYHKAKIPEYWLIDARGEEIVFQILLWRRSGYVPAAVSLDGWQYSKVFEREFLLERKRNRRGGWTYTLRVKG
jgi:Uma2 family endonuclease